MVRSYMSGILQLNFQQASLLIADMVQAIGAVLSLKWAHAGKVEVGTFCTAQGRQSDFLSMFLFRHPFIQEPSKLLEKQALLFQLR